MPFGFGKGKDEERSEREQSTSILKLRSQANEIEQQRKPATRLKVRSRSFDGFLEGKTRRRYSNSPTNNLICGACSGSA